MKNHLIHRNSQKRIYRKNIIYYVVFKTDKNFGYFYEPLFCDLLIEELILYKKIKKFKLCAFSIMPDHINLLLMPNDDFNISKIIKSLKENFSRDINMVIKNDFYEGDTSTCRLQMRRALIKCRHDYNEKYKNDKYSTPYFKWQKSFYDHVIRDVNDFNDHFNYVAYNHLKHNLSEDWHYTSINYPELVG